MIGKSLVASMREQQRDYNIWVDESSHITDAIAYSQQSSRLHRMRQSEPVPPPRIRATNIECRYCGAKPGEKCVRWSRRIKKLRRSPHRTRVQDTKLANQMLDALKPQ